MKILTGWPLEDEQTGIYIVNALKSLGHQVHNVDCKVLHRTALSDGKDVTDLLTQAMEEGMEKKPDLVFVSRQSWFTPFAEKYRGKLPIAGWNVDVRYDVNNWQNLFPLMKACSHWFTIAAGHVKWYRENINPNTYWLSEACDPAVHRSPNAKELELLKDDLRLKVYGSCDVSFAGSIDYDHVGPPNRVDLIRAVHEQFKLKTWGFQSRYLFNTEHSLMAFLSPINLGHSGWTHVALSMSARDYRVMGAGGFLLTNKVDCYEKIFVEGQDFETYSTVDECLEKIRYYLEHPEERERIRKRGMERVHYDHTFVRRMDRMLDIMGGYPDGWQTMYDSIAFDDTILSEEPDNYLSGKWAVKSGG